MSKSASIRIYEIWLERNAYCRHLDKLMKIKQGYLTTKSNDKWHQCKSQSKSKTGRLTDKNTKRSDALNNSVNRSQIRHKPISQKSALSKKNNYFIDIENHRFIKRIANTKPVVNSRNPYANLTVRNDVRDHSRKNNNIRVGNLGKFLEFQKRKILFRTHKYTVEIKFHQLGQAGYCRKYKQFWCELVTNNLHLKSQLVNLNNATIQTFKFNLKNALENKHLTINLFLCKDLNYELYGSIKIPTLKLNQTETIYGKIEHHIEPVEFTITYESIKESDKQNLKLNFD